MRLASNRLGLVRALAGVAAVLVSAPASAHGHHRAHRGGAHHSYAHAFSAAAAPVIQCVAFAKQDTGVDISGNARDWWNNAAGLYQRGQRPEAGSILSFRENERMPLGHVAVVSGIEDSRTIVIDQSHWNSRGITRGVVVEDVSENNDWSAVRVQLGRGEGFGSIYPTHGFIYPRPDPQALPSDTAEEAPVVRRASFVRHWHVRHRHATEIAEAPERSRALDLRIRGAWR